MVFKEIGQGLIKCTDFIGDKGKDMGDKTKTGVEKIIKPLKQLGKKKSDSDDSDDGKTGAVKSAEKSADTKTAFEAGARRAQKHMRNIFVKPLEPLGEDFIVLFTPKSEEEKTFLEEALADTFLFSYMSKSERDRLINSMKKKSVEAGTKIIEQGDVGDYFYVIESGTVTHLVDGEQVGEAEKGDTFGELALMYDCPRAATCIAKTDCDLWRVDQGSFRRIRRQHTVDEEGAKEAIRQVDFLKDLDDDRIEKLADAVKKQHFKKGDHIFEKGKHWNFIMIQQGKIMAKNIHIGGSDIDDHVLVPGDVIGERNLVSSADLVMPGDGMAMSDGKLYTISRERLQTILQGLPLEEMLRKWLDKKVLELTPALYPLDPAEFDELASLVETIKMPKGYVISSLGKSCSPAYCIIRSGKIEVKSKTETNTYTTEGYFGANTIVGLKDAKSKIVSQETITVLQDASVGILTPAVIESVIGDLGRLGKKKPKRNMESVTLESIDKRKILGAGTFGQVWLCCIHKDPTPYALKVQFKREIIGYNQVDGVMREKKIMAAIDHPFVIGLMKTYQDAQSIYMLMPLIQGGEMHNVIYTDSRDGVSEDVAKFYSANILEGLIHMHSKRIIHRDLKFENVMMDKDGYCVLIDLGFAKNIRRHYTYTFCGTPLFIAPEVVLSKGHDTGADVWSYGVMIYEMVIGRNPFYDGKMDQLALFKAIAKGKFKFPRDIVTSRECMEIIKKLLTVDEDDRLGCGQKGTCEIRKHAWFKKIDFKQISNKEAKTPWVPSIKDPFDATHFDDWKGLEKKKKKLKALSPKEQELFIGF
mmetsp:Transcript_11715/g.17200  ORF Transcript_11715/g.17200 Transcript_11715/m.17200 type:complete len:813 (-) Transcript_11715:117-2555(-)